MKLRTLVLAAVFLFASATGFAATNEFYANLLRRGIVHVHDGKLEAGLSDLQLAAFGLLEDLPNYEKAEIYICVAASKLGRADLAATAATKAARAERMQPLFAALDLDPEIRASFRGLVPTLASPELLAAAPAFVSPDTQPGTVVAASAHPPATPPIPQPPPPAKPAPAASPSTASEAEPAGSAPPLRSRQEISSADAQRSSVPAHSPTPPKAVQVTPPVMPADSTVSAVAASDRASVEPIPARNATPAAASVKLSDQKAEIPPAVRRSDVSRPAKTQPEAPSASMPAHDSQGKHSTVAEKGGAPEPGGNAQVSPLVAAAQRSRSNAANNQMIDSRLVAISRLLADGQIAAARQEYLEIARMQGLTRGQSLEVGRGLNQVSAWRESSAAYSKVLPFRRGEELHMFYAAVDDYERGAIDAARTLLEAAIPALPLTPEVANYRDRILKRR